MPDFALLTPYMQTTVPDLNFADTQGNFATSGRSEYVGGVFTGWVDIPTPGTWTFYTSSDDGSKLWINDQLVVTNDDLHGMEESSGVITIAAAGKHSIRAEFFENDGGAGMIVSWQSSTVSKEVIPSGRFSTTAA